MALLSDLETLVRTQIRDNGTTQAFQNIELDQFIMDAVAQYSRYKPRKRPYTLNLVAGTASYTLPTDWIRVDRPSFDYAKSPNRSELYLYGVYAYEFDVIMTMPANLELRQLCFDWYDSDQSLTVTPTPLIDYTMNFDYFALHQVSPTVACTIPADEQYVAMYWAAAQALDALVTDKAGKTQVYKAKDVEVDNSKMVESLEARAENFRQVWNDQIMSRPRGTKGGSLDKFDWGFPYGSWG